VGRRGRIKNGRKKERKKRERENAIIFGHKPPRPLVGPELRPVIFNLYNVPQS
jgi:hypothetical protein